jgi:hypothetical protein
MDVNEGLIFKIVTTNGHKRHEKLKGKFRWSQNFSGRRVQKMKLGRRQTGPLLIGHLAFRFGTNPG